MGLKSQVLLLLNTFGAVTVHDPREMTQRFA